MPRTSGTLNMTSYLHSFPHSSLPLTLHSSQVELLMASWHSVVCHISLPGFTPLPLLAYLPGAWSTQPLVLWNAAQTPSSTAWLVVGSISCAHVTLVHIFIQDITSPYDRCSHVHLPSLLKLWLGPLGCQGLTRCLVSSRDLLEVCWMSVRCVERNEDCCNLLDPSAHLSQALTFLYI